MEGIDGMSGDDFEQSNDAQASDHEPVVIPPFKTPIDRGTIEGVFEMYSSGDPVWLVAEAMKLSRAKVAAILSPTNAARFPVGWRKYSEI